MRFVIEALMAMAATQRELDKRLFDRYLSYPHPHAETHMGGDDSVESRDLPSAITIGAEGEIGDPTRGYATGGHIHDTTALDFLGSLDEICVDNLGQASVRDVNLIRVLEELLLVSYDIRDEVLRVRCDG